MEAEALTPYTVVTKNEVQFLLNVHVIIQIISGTYQFLQSSIRKWLNRSTFEG